MSRFTPASSSYDRDSFGLIQISSNFGENFNSSARPSCRAYEFELDSLKVRLIHAATSATFSAHFSTVKPHHVSCCYLALIT